MRNNKTPFVIAIAATLPLLAGACSVDRRTGDRTLTGAAVGAAGGAAIGLLSGGFLSSALTGAAAGAAGGFVYDQIKKD
jgi:osmotically inducible lipoprotein OsmB